MKADEPAFPILIHVPSEYRGLTKREFAAIKIMAGLLANSDVEYETDEELTADVIRMTDALIEALNK